MFWRRFRHNIRATAYILHRATPATAPHKQQTDRLSESPMHSTTRLDSVRCCPENHRHPLEKFAFHLRMSSSDDSKASHFHNFYSLPPLLALTSHARNILSASVCSNRFDCISVTHPTLPISTAQMFYLCISTQSAMYILLKYAPICTHTHTLVTCIISSLPHCWNGWHNAKTLAQTLINCTITRSCLNCS